MRCQCFAVKISISIYEIAFVMLGNIVSVYSSLLCSNALDL
uniref:Uncharacterized protein n=1 Tax=Arundo donax TaxID=35708 RepID=A0A0A9A3K1_ARUDO